MEIEGKHFNIPAHAQPLFDAMKEGKTIKSVTCIKGSNHPDEFFTIHNFKANTYSAPYGWNNGEAVDYVEVERDDDNERKGFFMNRVVSFELYEEEEVFCMRIHFTVNGFSDYYTLEGTVEEIKEQNEAEMLKRGLEYERNKMWSEKLT
jgi:hypothetical protein